MNKTKTIKSPLRYPGGKSRAIKILDKYMPKKVDYYYEPFVGGGSVLIHVMQKYLECKSFLINDIRGDLMNFYNQCIFSSIGMYEVSEDWIGIVKGNLDFKRKAVLELTSNCMDIKDVYSAMNFFIGNRTSFTGDPKLSGVSPQAIDSRFTESSLRRLQDFAIFMRVKRNKMATCTCRFQEFIRPVNFQGGAFMFIDPPYYHNGKSKLYKNHKDFDHLSLKLYIDKIAPHCKFMLTYGDCPEIREMYKNYNIIETSWSYGIGADKKGKELIIRNYE